MLVCIFVCVLCDCEYGYVFVFACLLECVFFGVCECVLVWALVLDCVRMCLCVRVVACAIVCL